MNAALAPSSRSGRVRELARVLLEALLVAVAGLVFALSANQVSPRGLVLARDYFPGATTLLDPHGSNHPAPAPISVANAPPSAGETKAANPVVVRLAQQGLTLIDHTEAVALFRDPRYEQERVVFVDARNAQAYAESHIPGAYSLDHYYPEKYLPDVLPACQLAEKVVVYCTGGECEDSEFTAVMLKEAGIPADRLAVYGGGIHAWKEHGMPLETGARGSGPVAGTADP